jgi:hypothetical protein
MLIEVKETHPPTGPRRSGTVVTMDGEQLDCWPNVIRTIQVGKQYEVETSTNDRGYTSITKATPVNGAASHTANGVAHPTGNGNGGMPVASSVTDEAAFVREVLSALILKGEVPYTKRALYDATEALRGLWGAPPSAAGRTGTEAAMIETCIHCHNSGPLEGPGGELVPAGYPNFAHQRCLAATNPFDLDGLATASLHFTALADELPACPHRDALRLAADIAHRLSDLRSKVMHVIIAAGERENFDLVDAVRELRRALEETAKGDGHGEAP